MNKVLNFERFNRVSNKREKVGYCALYNEADRAVLNFYGDICMYDCSGYGGEYANDKCPQQVADFLTRSSRTSLWKFTSTPAAAMCSPGSPLPT